ncbi:UDP-N-acetylmuramoyl-L-alanine--D-glutamate ligase [Evansella cellulosilytica]|uniref:UDP-N-acetylmuramoylalanine--D-glutamate ligase n=1 Tax=Evansella cellulosilytica (strain ATCC 21833 / DSM 2522 / FERM P-1141 / JCM 9156 / N-4) TaxID=649639 RepID=E6TTT1_EVAC2|nr:UDP-N-acetylmuramoyl-L-alanine--D-glutamate ligase [Evansella cellulosilytica]ADU30850.1 UDP-N-acetylmuramoylalanine/D-glutamate ligase [Evansella cellulosilytica DSM 2522]
MKMTAKYKNKKVLVLGLAKSGTAAAKLLLELEANVIVNDQKPLEENIAAQSLQDLGAEVVCGSHPLTLISDDLDYVVKNPGIPYTNPLVSAAMEKAIPVLTEVELAYHICEADIIGITGSNGKTTTTTYIYEMLKGSEKDPLLAGNIGEVACEVAQKATEKNVLVTELSSFQLMGIDEFKPKISLLLNLVEAHIDYHGTMDAYVHAKGNIFKNQTSNDYIIYNADDKKVSKLVELGQATLIPFSTKGEMKHGACIENGYLTVFGKRLLPVEEMSLPGEHNVANGLAAAAAAHLAGASEEKIRQVLKSFSGVAHRLQYVDKINGRTFYNNSKATNVPATITALKAFEQPIVLIAGGLDRGLSFDDLIPYFKKKVKCVVSYGETAQKLVETAKKANIELVHCEKTLENAVKKAYVNSEEGDIILLSPACASWDQYRTFEERGEHFVNEVKKFS